MPANLTPDYERAEARYRAAATDDDRLAALRDMFATIPKHKGTEKLQADLKRRISELRKSALQKKKAGGTDLFHVPRAGAGQIVLVGPPNVGKSLLATRAARLDPASSPARSADYPFTTTLPVPVMAHFEDVPLELVDTPPVTAEHIPTGLLGTIRAADLIALVADISAEPPEDPLSQFDMLLGLLASRGLNLRTAPLPDLDPSDVSQHSVLLLANKLDLAADPVATLATLRDLYAPRFELLGISAQTGEGLDPFLRRAFELLALLRIYTKQPGHPPDRQKPFTLEQGATVEDLARTIHRELPAKMKFARLWRDGHPPGQQIHRTEPLHDKDIIEIHE